MHVTQEEHILRINVETQYLIQIIIKLIQKIIEYSVEKMKMDQQHEEVDINELLQKNLPFKTYLRKKKKINKNRRKKNKAQNTENTNIHRAELIFQQMPSYFKERKAQILRKYIFNDQFFTHVKELLCLTEKNAANNDPAAQHQSSIANIKEYLETIEGKAIELVLKQGRKAILVRLLLRKDNKNISQFLNKSMHQIYRVRQIVQQQIYELVKSKNHEHNAINLPTMELLSLAYTYNVNRKYIQQIISKLQISPQSDQNKQSNSVSTYSNTQDQYIALLMIKNLKKSFDQSQISYLTYFQRAQSNITEGGYTIDQSVFREEDKSAVSIRNFHSFIKARTPKIQCKLQLHSACSACLSDYVQLSNPILSCPQCHARVHKHCQQMQKRCHRCRYNRTSNKQKQISEYCFICKRNSEKGLMIVTTNHNYPHQFAHCFCLLIHGMWKITGGQFVYQPVGQGLEYNACKYCRKQSFYQLKCVCCNGHSHAMCGYLNGCSFIMGATSGDIRINCCGKRQKERRELANMRKFKINFEKLVFNKEFIQEILQ